MALFYSPPDGSTAHHLMNGPLALFPTLDSLGLLDNHERLSRNNTDVSQVPTWSSLELPRVLPHTCHATPHGHAVASQVSDRASHGIAGAAVSVERPAVLHVRTQ